MAYRSGYIRTKIFRDSDGDVYNGISVVKAEEELESFLNKLDAGFQEYKIVNISMSVDNGKTSILLVWKYV